MSDNSNIIPLFKKPTEENFPHADERREELHLQANFLKSMGYVNKDIPTDVLLNDVVSGKYDNFLYGDGSDRSSGQAREKLHHKYRMLKETKKIPEGVEMSQALNDIIDGKYDAELAELNLLDKPNNVEKSAA